MSAKFRTLTIAAVVIIAVVGFYTLRDNYPPNGDEVTGAIGTVEKHQQDQITPADVVLEGYDTAAQDAIGHGGDARKAYRQALIISDGEFSIFFTRTYAGPIMVAAIILLFLPLFKIAYVKLRKARAAEQ